MLSTCSTWAVSTVSHRRQSSEVKDSRRKDVLSPLLPWRDIVRSATLLMTYPLSGVDLFSMLPTALVVPVPAAKGGRKVKIPSRRTQYL